MRVFRTRSAVLRSNFSIVAALLVEFPFPAFAPDRREKRAERNRFLPCAGSSLFGAAACVDQEPRCLDAERGINDGREAVGPVMAALVKQRTRAPSRRTIRR